MLVYLLRRLLAALAVTAAVSFIAFLLLAVMPGDAADAAVGEFASEAQLQAVRQEMGLDRPLLGRYVRFAAGVLHGELGESLISGRAVATLIGERFPYTALLALAALLLAVILGLAVGGLAAARAGSLLDLALMAASTLGLSLPTFWLALLLILFFSLRLGWLPVVGAGTPGHLVLPAISLALPLAAVVARLLRASLLDVAGTDFVRTAHAKGLPVGWIWRGHILRNALIPVITLLGVHAGHLLGGAVIVETIFGWPGLGRLIVQAILDSDTPVVLGAVLLMAAIYQALNLLVDLAQALLDPRVGASAL